MYDAFSICGLLIGYRRDKLVHAETTVIQQEETTRKFTIEDISGGGMQSGRTCNGNALRTKCIGNSQCYTTGITG